MQLFEDGFRPPLLTCGHRLSPSPEPFKLFQSLSLNPYNGPLLSPVDRMKRRAFISMLGSAAAMSFASHAQDRVRRVGMLMNFAVRRSGGPNPHGRVLQSLQELGWTVGRDVQVDTRWTAGDPERYRKFAAELAALAPDVLLAAGTSAVMPLREVARGVPIVFTNVVDPVGFGLVDSLARPGLTSPASLYTSTA